MNEIKQKMTKKQRGFSLIEVLVALVILSVGLLGVAALQLTSLQTNREAYLRTQAVIAGTDLLERMRANKPAALSGDYSTSVGTMPTGSKNCSTLGAACTTTEMAAYDLIAWKCGLGKWNENSICTGLSTTVTAGELTNGDGSVSQDINGIYSIIVQYEDQTGSTQSLEVEGQL